MARNSKIIWVACTQLDSGRTAILIHRLVGSRVRMAEYYPSENRLFTLVNFLRTDCLVAGVFRPWLSFGSGWVWNSIADARLMGQVERHFNVKSRQLHWLKKVLDEAERVLLALQQDGLPKGKYPHLAGAIEAANSIV